MTEIAHNIEGMVVLSFYFNNSCDLVGLAEKYS